MRAPPLAEKQIKGSLRSRQYSPARTNFSPTTAPIDPPIKANSKATATTSSCSSSWPFIHTSASFSPVAFWAWERRSLYFLLSRNFSRSTDSRSANNSSRPSSASNHSSRCRAGIRIWCSHLGQTSRLRSSSGR